MERHYGMDWLRIGAFALLIFYHIGMVFVPWGFHIKTARPMDWVEIPMLLTNPWRLTLLFVVSGYASRALWLKSPSIRSFLGNRSARLLIPLVFGMAVIVPPQTWVELVGKHGYGQSYLWFSRMTISASANSTGSSCRPGTICGSSSISGSTAGAVADDAGTGSDQAAGSVRRVFGWPRGCCRSVPARHQYCSTATTTRTICSATGLPICNISRLPVRLGLAGSRAVMDGLSRGGRYRRQSRSVAMMPGCWSLSDFSFPTHK